MQPPPQNQLETLEVRVQMHDERIAELKAQLHEYQKERENELKLQNIRDRLEALSHDLLETRLKQEELRTEVINVEKEAQIKDAALHQRINTILINVLRWSVGLGVGAVLSFLTIYVTHLIH